MFYFLQKNKTKMTPNQRNIPRRINQSRIPESEIQKYWAAYMNMARHYLFTTLKFIGETVGVDTPKSGFIAAKGKFEFSLAEEQRLSARLDTFRSETNARKSVLLTLITANGLKYNSHSDIVQNEVTLEELFI